MTTDTQLAYKRPELRDDLDVELNRLEELKRNFIALTAHELRNPVAVLLGYAKILEERLEGPQQESAAVISAQALRLKNLVDTIVTLYQFDAHELKLQLSTVSLGEIIQSVILSQRFDISQKSLSVENQVSLQTFAQVDRERMTLVITNLLSNAIKFSPRGGRILITAETRPGSLVASIRDEGVGILPEEQNRIFERFHQIGDSLTRRHSGIGLGLVLAKVLIELHNGTIWVESELNKGSTFYFSLPQAIKGDVSVAKP